MNKNTYLLLLAAIVLCFPLKAQDKMDAMVNRLKAFGNRIPQEQVFLHVDNSSYYLGDTIFYKAYVNRSDNGKPTDLSGILYCELLDNDGYLVERQMIPLERGEGHGDFALTDTMLYSGYYELRAYTRWQLNWGVTERPHSRWVRDYFFNRDMVHDYYRDYEKLYSRVFPVYDRPRIPGDFSPDMSLRPLAEYHKADSKRESIVEFFPEGGSLVAGLKQRVAWEARDEKGQALDGTLTVTLPGGGTVVSETQNRGRGVFEIEAAQGPAITAVFSPKKGNDTSNPADVPEAKVLLPRVVKNGVALRVDADADGITISCLATDTASRETLGLTIMHNGVLRHFCRLDGNDVHFVPTEAGVYQATVFNADGRVYADRLAFFLPAGFQAENVTFSADGNTVYKPFAPVTMELHGSPGASMSLSVRDAARSEYTYDTGTSLTERLLSSQIRGFVPHPQWFFQQDDPQRRLALDLLLMVQGWRRYSWHQMAVPGAFVLAHKPESRYPHWTGQVHNYSTAMALDDFEKAAMQQSDGSSDAMGNDYKNKEVQDAEATRDDSDGGRDDATSGNDADDPRSRFNKRERSLKYPVAVHAEFSQTGNNGVDGDMRSQGVFSLDFPRYYEEFFFFLGASDTTKWKNGRPPVWTQNGKSKNEETEYPEFYVKLNPIYPRFPQPYDYYQSHLAPMHKDSPLYDDMDEQVRMLSEVTVGARRNGARNFKHWRPAFVLDAYEAFNATCDAGLAPGCFLGRDRFVQDVARTYLGDMGTDKRYDIAMRLEGKAVAGLTAAQSAKQATDIPGGAIPESKSFSFTGHKLNKYNYLWNLGDVYVYTDYAPRSPRRNVSGGSVPQVTIDLHAVEDDGERMYFRNRRWKMKGFSVPDEFYSPDYSRQPLPKEDHRRTLYWNPDVKLDENGSATVRFYNNSSETMLQIRAEGWTPDGMPQCGDTN
ncbi:MAG: hypothetical protein NC113_03410 [Bacteroides sp.]|nr:hypothetical protein [Bacteroides sp.]MCM1447259.1 hypothetical protein [Bacteroides sp.]